MAHVYIDTTKLYTTQITNVVKETIVYTLHPILDKISSNSYENQIKHEANLTIYIHTYLYICVCV